MEKPYQHISDGMGSLSPANRELIAGLQEAASLLEDGIINLHPAAQTFAEIYTEQESKKLNIMKAASMIEVEGEKMKTNDFIMMFNDMLAAAVDKVLDAAKNSMRMSLYLNAAIEALAEIKTIMADNPAAKTQKSNIGLFVSQISVDLAACQETLKNVVTTDIDETLEMQTKLGQLLKAFNSRNMQIMQMTGNPPLSTRRMEEALNSVGAELKNSRLAKYKIEKLITKINEEGN